MSTYIHTSNGKKPIPSPSEVLFENVKQVEEEILRIEEDIERLENLKTSLTAYGMCILSNQTTLTDSTGFALPTTEKNPNISGSLANQIQTNKNNITNLQTNVTNHTNEINSIKTELNELKAKTSGVNTKGLRANFDTSDKSTAAYMMYDYTTGNWCGLGCDPGGLLTLRQGTDGAYVFQFKWDGIYLNGNRITN